MRAKGSKDTSGILFLISAGLVLFYVFFSLWGCATTAGVETAAIYRSEKSVWRDGRVAEDVDRALPKVVQAAIMALQALQLNLTKTEIKKDAALIIGEYVDNRTIWIDLCSISERSTHLEIRVSVQGDKKASYRILGKIQEFLQRD